MIFFKELLERNGIELAGFDSSFMTTPVSPFFLEEKFIRDTAEISEFPQDITDEAVKLAGEILQTPTLKSLAWHLYRLLCILPNFKAYPDHIDLLGERTGILFVLLHFSLYPHFQLRMKLDGLPPELADRAMTRSASLLPNRGIIYPGEKGLQGRAFPFMLNYKNTSCFRIGRFDYVLTKALSTYPELFRSRTTKEYVALCKANWKVDEQGFLAPFDSETVPAVGLIEKDNCFTGRKIDLVTGLATTETVTVDLNEYERLLPPDANVLLIHIPGGGGMTIEKCKESFIEAREFFTRYFPQRPIASFGCISWVFNPAWREYIPESNVSKLQKSALSFPTSGPKTNGLYFVFARDDGDPSTYPADNSMRRAMIRAWNEKGTLRSAGILLPFDEIDNFPLDMGN